MHRPGIGTDADYELCVPHFDAKRGARIGIIGESGSGKTTFLEVLGLLAWPDQVDAFDFTPMHDAGTVDLATALRSRRTSLLSELRARTIGFILQDGGLLPYLSVRENAKLARSLAGRPDDMAKIESLAAKLGIDGYLDRYQSALSGGQRQRAAILRTLATDVPLLLADEPTASLDPGNSNAVLKALAQTTAESGTTVIAVSHNAKLLSDYGFELVKVVVEEGDNLRRATLEPA